MFQFKHPEILWLLVSAPVVGVVLFAYLHWRRLALKRLGDTTRLMPDFSGVKFWIKGALAILALILLTITWANPEGGSKTQTTTQKVADIFIALDISQSMLCRDIAPSRLERAKIFAQKLVQNLEGDRVGLIFFAGNAFLAVPLSTDYPFLLQSLQTASPDLLTEQGTAIASALELAEKSFEAQAGGGYGAVVLITDGENHDEVTLEAVKNLKEKGGIVLPVGVGTSGGGPIPTSDWEGSQFKHDENGEIVLTRLNEAMLQKMAESGGTQALNVSRGEQAEGAVVREAGNLKKRAIEVHSLTERNSYYQWFLLPALLLLAIEKAFSLRQTSKVIPK
ncbi:MAG: VWA domain-containing protein [Saprospiraceae bacterium]